MDKGGCASNSHPKSKTIYMVTCDLCAGVVSYENKTPLFKKSFMAIPRN